jgi:hypothetical protein
MRKVYTKLLSILFLLGIWVIPAGQAAEAPEAITLSVGDMGFKYTPETGAQLSIYGIPILKENAFWVAKPQWTGHYYGAIYNKEIIKTAVIEDFRGGKKVTLHLTLQDEKKDYIKGTETFILLPDNTYSDAIEFIVPKSEPAVVEWSFGSLNSIPMIGKPFYWTTGIATTQSVIPVEAVCADPGGISTREEFTLAKGFKNIIFDSVIGPIEIKTSPEYNLVAYDYRKAQWNRENDSYFWLGKPEAELQAGHHYNYSMSIKFPVKVNKEAVKSVLAPSDVRIIPVKAAQSPAFDFEAIVPTPKSVKYTHNHCLISGKKQPVIYIGREPSQALCRVAGYLAEELQNIYKIQAEIKKESSPAPGSKNPAIYFYAENSKDFQKGMKPEGMELPTHIEGYALDINKNKVRAYAHDEKGIFYAFTTLMQMVKVDEKGVYFKGGKITDYPSSDFRGLHTFTSHTGKNVLENMMSRIVSRNKMNSWVWQVDRVIWDTCPELEHKDYGMKKADAIEVRDVATDHFVEIIPCLQTYGHGEWLFTNGKNLDFAEDSTLPNINLYCTKNPKSYVFLDKVMQEVVDTFKPRYFHINHDEISMPNGGPLCSHAPGKTDSDIIVDNIKILHNWLAKRNIKTMIWGDVFLYQSEGPDACNAPSLEEAKKRREMLPKDIIITDWHYIPVKPEAYTSLKLWKDEGFQTIGASWFMPNNARNLALAGIQSGALGNLQCTWAGYTYQLDTSDYDWMQYWAYLWAGHYAWSGDTTPLLDLPFDAPQRFIDNYFGRYPLLAKKSGFQVDLSPYYNRCLDEKKGHWLGYGPDWDLSSFPLKRTQFGETYFWINPDKKGNAAALLAGVFNPKGEFPARIEIPLKKNTASELHFLLNTAFKTANFKEVGKLTLNYADGTKAVNPLIYKKNAFSYDDLRPSRVARIVWRGKTRIGHRMGVRDLVWQNPYPEKEILSVTLESNNTEAAPVLMGLTGVN